MASHPSTPPIPGQRSLAAIVFTDVVSFSALMQENEEATLRLLKQDFDTMREICVQHEGSVLKTTGDGLLLHFASAVQAVACALAIQRTFAERAKSNPPEKPLAHRVGIHLGDVFVDKEDVMGDGVNIAARLQAEAEPGGICISQTVYHVVRNKLALQVTRLGPRELKNISQAIPIYKLLLKAQSIEEAAKAGSTAPDDGSNPPMPAQLISRRIWLIVGVGLVVVAVAALGFRAWVRNKQVALKAAAEQRAFDALMAEEDHVGEAKLRATRTNLALAEWRRELKEKRSLALEEYDFAALRRDLRTAKPDDARIRGLVLQRVEYLFTWMRTHMQKYNEDNPLVVRELTGTAPKEIQVFVRADRRLYYKQGGATRQRDWTSLEPSVNAAIVAGAMSQAETLPPKDAVQAALAFASLYNLPELQAALQQARLQRLKR